MEKRTHRFFKKAKSERRLRFSIRKFSVGVASVAIAAFAFLGANTVSADTLTNTNTVNAAEQSSSTVSSSENSTKPESERITNKETSATSVDTSSTTSSTDNISSTGKENTKALSEKGNEESSSTTNSLNTNKEGLGAGETVENVLQNAVTVNGTVNVGQSTVTKDNFLDYFKLNGSATYDKDTGIVTLTTDTNNLVGNFTLKSKIDMNQSFNIDGEVNLGDKTKDQGGADGISFSFHDGNTTDVGQFGGNLGIGGLRSAESFKLDTYYNYYRKPNGDPRVSNEVYGWPADPIQSDGQYRLVYGSFAKTKYENIDGYDRWWVHNDEARAQNLDSSDLDGKFHKFTINYDGTTKKLTVTYQSNKGLLTWEKTVKTVNEIMAMNVAASTGGSRNLQQFKINSFEYSQAASVDVAYVDTDGKTIGEGQATYPDGPYKGKTYKTEKKDIKGFTFKEIDSNGLPAEGTLNEWGTNGTVTYIYTRNIQKGKIQFLKDNKDGNAPVLEKELSVSGGSGTKVDRDITSELKNLSDKGFKVTSNTFTGDQYFDYDDNNDQVWKVIYEEQSEAFTESHKVTRKISYVYEDGKTDGRPTLKDSVTQEAEFTREGTRNPVTKTIQKVEAWKPSDKKLSEETTPVVPGFIADKTKVDELTVTPESPNTDVVVTYKKLGSWVPKVPDGFTPPPSIVYPNDPTDPTKPQNPTDPGYPVIPNVPGTTPVGPDGVTPLTPVDPNDPSKGYIPPSLPSEPGKDTPITYVENPKPDKPENQKPLNYKPKGDDSSKAVLPNTGVRTSSSVGLVVGMLSAIIGVSLVTKRKKKTDEE